jgi:glycosyltransferase involved in cell wall biosynthesis
VKPVIGIIYKNFAANKGISHIGLGVSGSLNAQVLTEKVGPASVIPAVNNIEIVRAIVDYNKANPNAQLTHVIISAPWLSTRDVRAIVTHFNKIKFAVLSHSNVGFLQADPNGTRLLREGLQLSLEVPNFTIAGNSKKFVEWMEMAYGVPVALLPNMYPTVGAVKAVSKIGPIKIGIFGAIRPQKNVLTAAAGAIVIGRVLNRPVELWINSGREEGGTGTLTRALWQLTKDLPNFELKQAKWAPWNIFRKTVESMDLLIQVSYTESFNMVTADGISCGVPSVVSDAIYWAPKEWVAKSDDALDVARIGVKLLTSENLRAKGIKAIKRHNDNALKSWKKFLGVEPSFWQQVKQLISF